MAALRMNGVVSPQHAPTMRKPKIQRKMDGCGSFVSDMSTFILPGDFARDKREIRCNKQ
jgi:hypothetical protein